MKLVSQEASQLPQGRKAAQELPGSAPSLKIPDEDVWCLSQLQTLLDKPGQLIQRPGQQADRKGESLRAKQEKNKGQRKRGGKNRQSWSMTNDQDQKKGKEWIPAYILRVLGA